MPRATQRTSAAPSSRARRDSGCSTAACGARGGTVLGREMRAYNNLGWYRDAGGTITEKIGLTGFGPNINIARDPRFGRTSELPGEDPVLNGLYAAAMVGGMQRRDKAGYPLMLAYVKHFSAYSRETDRGHDDYTISRFDLADTYLRQYELAFTLGGASGAMCSYNAVNGRPSCANDNVLKQLLRAKWATHAIVTSDCGAVSNLRGPPVNAPSDAAAAAYALNNGTDIEMGSSLYRNALSTAILQGLTREETIDAAVARTQRQLFTPAADSAQPFRGGRPSASRRSTRQAPPPRVRGGAAIARAPPQPSRRAATHQGRPRRSPRPTGRLTLRLLLRLLRRRRLPHRVVQRARVLRLHPDDRRGGLLGKCERHDHLGCRRRDQLDGRERYPRRPRARQACAGGGARARLRQDDRARGSRPSRHGAAWAAVGVRSPGTRSQQAYRPRACQWWQARNRRGAPRREQRRALLGCRLRYSRPSTRTCRAAGRSPTLSSATRTDSASCRTPCTRTPSYSRSR